MITARCMLAVVLCLASAGAAAETLRCGNRLVAPGDPPLRVRALCGEPDHRERWQPFAGLPQPMEVWIYDRGPGQLVRELYFRDGRLVRIRTGDYGGDPGDCRPEAIAPGISGWRLRRQCGEPDSVEVLDVLAPHPVPVHPPAQRPRHWRAVRRELWVYNFGARYLLREVVLENGVVHEVRTVGRGFGPDRLHSDKPEVFP